MAEDTTPSSTATAAAAKSTFNGSCHCGKIRYTLAVALTDPPSATRCNCTLCEKMGFTNIRVADPAADFQLQTPAALAELPSYSYRTKDVRRYFCDKCGVHVVGAGSYEFQGQVHHFFSVNLHTLDQPQDGLDLSTFTYTYVDGLRDNWMAAPKSTPYPNGSL